MEKGFAGRIAEFFINSKLTILLMIALMIIGVYSSTLIPREEEPQIIVPMADVMVGYPGANPTEVENRVVKPLEKIISNIKGVEHVHSMAMNGKAMLIVQFYVGEDTERSYVKLYDELMKHKMMFPKGVYEPIVKTRSIDDVPMLGLTLWSENYNDYQLRQITEELASEIKKVKDVSLTNVIGGRARQLKVILDKAKMAESSVDALSVMQMIQASNGSSQTGSFVNNNQEYLLTTGQFLTSKEDVENLVVGTSQNMPVYLKQIAKVEDGASSPANYVSMGFGQHTEKGQKNPSEYPAITLSVSKVKGADAMKISEQILEKVEHLKKNLIPADVHVEVTRNYGETASHKVSELLMHLGVAILAVTILVMLAMGLRGGLVVFLSVPLTFALTLFSYYVLGYTLNRITLFALVFVVGIVVDDSIIIAENMHRHFHMRKLPFKEAAIYAINEVGNPTILATFTVIAAILPMAFVSGMMGPYMSPMPIGASIAMLLSLFVALTITPYLGYHLLKVKDDEEHKEEQGLETSLIYKWYKKIEQPLLDSSKKRWTILGITAVLLLISVLAFFTKWVAVKMLPFDNKNEIQVVIDMPEGTPLEKTAAVTKDVAQYLRTVPEVVNYQNYIGASSPITFNGLVRHYDMRGQSNTADIQVNLLDKSARSKQSHDVAKTIRPEIQKIAKKYGANIKIVEVPPGPPVLSTIVAEVYGPNYEEQVKVADQVQQILKQTDDVVDVDWMVEAPQTEFKIIPDNEKSMLNGIAPQQLVGNLTYLMGEYPISTLYDEKSNQPVNMVMKLDDAEKATLQDITALKVKGQMGNMLPISDIAKVEKHTLEKSIYRKDQKRVVYVLADMAGVLESPAYAILGMEEKLKKMNLPEGYSINELYMAQPSDESDFTVKWDGEWQITLEVFRDLGAAFLVVVIIIYMLIVGWFQNFKTPIVMMIAIPLSLVGIVLGHWLLGAFFTATSFIGMIALAGVMVRNSVLLIDFIEIRLNEGVPMKQAIIEAGAVRTTPILLTTGAVVIGAVIILFDPIFQGLAISLVFGAIVSTVLTLLVVPLVYYMTEKKKWDKIQSEQSAEIPE
ncbi:efflux RND transporter permease subunit [Riemerella anatipestifer]|uniref:Efflux RND transporter permease subunit n=1 Tax=Riemerella anatipestifer TaxID=34085 RepID=A0AAP3AN83_RIEAN|nr:efflux RND transporter permease subunit [Riemerella anatipestifer]AZZ58225.1 AcrB/AcrD/AcrF family protein [Riemerella anatipestifer]MBT0550513.1 efflux RND transporter permease subunit [Riemerella anatipestifer]MBT0553377.1 efflux RND transporter permease subunit [Riemerella anatipestifer]MBT0574015.1 efflux RND transporter permease subunit [Riemerella anatipestifer]MCE3023376.1 efflux RND transporter permease subunit [Riemerella anatipestifer]